MNNIDKILEKAFILFCLLVLINLTIQHIYAASSVNTSVSVSDHTHQDAYGNATLNDPTNRLVVTSTTPAINLTIASTTTNPTIDYSALITGGTGTIGAMTLTANNAYGVIIAIPQSVITNTNTSWDGIMNAPTPTTLTLPTVSGENRTLSEAIEFGLPDVGLTFSRAIKITFPNQGGKRIGYIRTGINFTDINTACNSANDQAIMDAQFTGSITDCKITSGNDLIIWTKHFTKFATFSSTSTSSGDSPLAPLTSNTTSNPVCNDSKPVSAPVLLPAKPGKNSVTLTWEKAKDPVTPMLLHMGLLQRLWNMAIRMQEDEILLRVKLRV